MDSGLKILVEPITLWLVASQYYKKVHQPCQNAGLADLLVAHDDELEQEVAGLSLTHPRFRQQQQEQQQQQQQQSLTPSTKVRNEAAAATKSRNRLKYFAFTFKKLVELRRWNERTNERKKERKLFWQIDTNRNFWAVLESGSFASFRTSPTFDRKERNVPK